MKVLYVVSGLGTGGAEMALFRLLDSLSKSRFESRVLCLGKQGFIAEKIKALGVPVYCCRTKSRSFIEFLHHSKFIVSEVGSFEPDIIQGWMYRGNLVSCLLHRSVLREARVVWGIRQSIQSFANEKWSTRMVITLCKILSKSPSGIVYNSEDGRKTHESLGFSRKNAVEILNGVDIGNRILDANSESLRTTLGKQRDTPIVAHIGRFHPKKDHQTLLQAFSRVSRAMPHVRFVLVGSNVDYANSELADTINRLTLSGVCHLLGEREDVDQILEETDVLVSSSSWGEGFPNVIAEAMSQGVLCVATDVGEARNIIGNAGFIVRPKKPLELATQIMTALNLSRAKRREISQCAVDRIQEKFSIEKSSSAYMELYENLASFRESFR